MKGLFLVTQALALPGLLPAQPPAGKFSFAHTYLTHTYVESRAHTVLVLKTYTYAQLSHTSQRENWGPRLCLWVDISQ